MNLERRRLGGIYSELDTAFATVQAAKLRRELGCEDAQDIARNCVTATAASVHRQMLGDAFSPAEIGLIEARLRALTGAAARVSPPKAAALPGR